MHLDLSAAPAATTMITPPIRKTSAIPRPTPSPSSQPYAARPSADSMYGISANSAIGAIRNALIGAAADSSAAAKPKTRPWVSNGTTFCTTVCSAASTAGISVM